MWGQHFVVVDGFSKKKIEEERMLTLDGSTLEGGGQLVRVALSVSSICKMPVHITNIRANRSSNNNKNKTGRGMQKYPGKHGSRNLGGSDRGGEGVKGDTVPKAKAGGGLKESHLAAVNWLAEKCLADVEGAGVGETDVVFKPKRNGAYHPLHVTNEGAETIALKNPGSVWLIWQAIFPYIVFNLPGNDPHRRFASTQPDDHPQDSRSDSDFRIILRGGTNVPKSPSSEYVQQVFLPLCRKIGLPNFDINVIQRGWAGSAPEIGQVEIVVHRSVGDGAKSAGKSSAAFSLQPFAFTDRGEITEIEMTIVAGSQETYSMLETQIPTALITLGSNGVLPTGLPITTHPSSTPASGDERRLYVLLVAHTSNGYRLGRDCLGTGRKITNESERRQMVAQVVGSVARELVAECRKGGCFDEYAEDQVVVFQALSEGRSLVDNGRQQQHGKGKRADVDGGGGGSLHTRTVRWVCEEMLGTVFDDQGGCLGRTADGHGTPV